LDHPEPRRGTLPGSWRQYHRNAREMKGAAAFRAAAG
jgi:hypothetical protein